MMDQAFFVGRKEILDWLNDLLKLNLTKIEQTASGAHMCREPGSRCRLLTKPPPAQAPLRANLWTLCIQVGAPVVRIACASPHARLRAGQVPMQKVKWDAKHDYEYVHNYKILQGVFNRLKIDKVRGCHCCRCGCTHGSCGGAQHIEVEKLVRAKYQDNLEFMQWMKRYFDLTASVPEVYDPVSRRNVGKGAHPCLALLHPRALMPGMQAVPPPLPPPRPPRPPHLLQRPPLRAVRRLLHLALPRAPAGQCARRSRRGRRRRRPRADPPALAPPRRTPPPRLRPGGRSLRQVPLLPHVRARCVARSLRPAPHARTDAHRRAAAETQKLRARVAELKLTVRPLGRTRSHRGWAHCCAVAQQLCWRGCVPARRYMVAWLCLAAWLYFAAGLLLACSCLLLPAAARRCVRRAAQVEGLEKERDFYFSKLRDVELLLQAVTTSDKRLADSILTILCAHAPPLRAPPLRWRDALVRAGTPPRRT